MEPHGRRCTGRPGSRWRIHSRTLLCGISICGIFGAGVGHAGAPRDSEGTYSGQEQPAELNTMQSLGVALSGTPMTLPAVVNSKAGVEATDGLAAPSLEYKAEAPVAAEHDGLASAKDHAVPAPTPVEGSAASLGDRPAGFSGGNGGAMEVRDTPEEPLSVSERVRRRFHTQKLFEDEGEDESGSALNPLPHSLIEGMLKEAQEESVRNDSRTKVICLSNCSMHGVCTPYGCSCAPGWGGVDCSSRSCPKNCSGNGVCVDGACKCTSGFLGVDCSESEDEDSAGGECPNNCSGNGTCEPFTRQCTCNEGFIGRTCGEVRCPNNCMPNGRCADNGQCVCNLGYGGADCSVEVCPNSCSGLGVCSSIGCLCYEGSGGMDCSQPQKANRATPFGCASDADCSNRGICEAGRCNCNTGFEADCSELAREVFSAVCKHSSSLYVLAFDSNLQPGIKTW